MTAGQREVSLMHRTGFVTILALLALFGTEEACRCVQQIPQTAYHRASAVLLGVIGQATDFFPYDRSLQIEVERSWK